jgi:hypothetical protein
MSHPFVTGVANGRAGRRYDALSVSVYGAGFEATADHSFHVPLSEIAESQALSRDSARDSGSIGTARRCHGCVQYPIPFQKVVILQ